MIYACTRLATSVVEVYWRPDADVIGRRDKVSGSPPARASSVRVCPAHEHELANGDLLVTSRDRMS